MAPIPTVDLILPARQCDFDREDGLWIASDDALRRIDLHSGDVQRVVSGLGADGVAALAVAPNGRRLVVADRNRCVVLSDDCRLTELDDPSTAIEVLQVEGIVDVAFGPRGERLALAHHQEGLLVVRSETLEPIWGAGFIAAQHPIMRFSADGLRLGINTCEAVLIYEVETGEQLDRVERENEPLFAWAADTALEELVLSTDCGDHLYRTLWSEEEAFGPLSSLPRVGGRTVALGHGAASEGVGFVGASADGELFVLGESAATPRLTWHIADADGVEPTRLDVSPSGRFVTSLWSDDAVRLIALGASEADHGTE